MLPFNEVLIILPTYNEIDNIEKMLNAIEGVSKDYHILVMDDNSPDGTADVVRKFQETNNNIHLIVRPGKLGLGTAYIAGFNWAMERDYNYIQTMDCDFSHDPQDLPRLLELAQSNDFVVGSRYTEGIRIVNWPLKRLMLSSFASFYVRKITGIPIKDPTAGFNLITRKAMEALNIDKIFSTGYCFLVELKFKVWSKGLRIVELPIIFYERRDGQSKMDGGVIFESVWAVFKLRLKKIFGTL